MSKYLELVEDSFNESHFDKQTSQNPYVAYSIKDDKVIYSLTGDQPMIISEILYTTSDGNIVNFYEGVDASYDVISNTYENGKGVVRINGVLTSLVSDFFKNSSTLTSIIIPDGVNTISHSAFIECSSLTSVVIPSSVVKIESYAFRNCKSLNSVTFEGTVEEWNSMDKDSNWFQNAPATYIQCSNGQVVL